MLLCRILLSLQLFGGELRTEVVVVHLCGYGTRVEGLYGPELCQPHVPMPRTKLLVQGLEGAGVDSDKRPASVRLAHSMRAPVAGLLNSERRIQELVLAKARCFSLYTPPPSRPSSGGS